MQNQRRITKTWGKVWEENTSDPESLLFHRFTREAYCEFRRLVPEPGSRMLELGCGTGRFSVLFAADFPDSRVTGLDLTDSSIELGISLASKYHCSNVSFEKGDLHALPFAASHFDFVFSEGVVQLFKLDGPRNQRDALKEMVRVTKPGGTVLVSVVNRCCCPHEWYKWWLRRRGLPYEYGYEHGFRRSELRRLFASCGLEDVRLGGYYPGYGYERLSWKLTGPRIERVRPLLKFLSRFMDSLGTSPIARRLGFEIVAVARKPR